MRPSFWKQNDACLRIFLVHLSQRIGLFADKRQFVHEKRKALNVL